MPKSKRAKVVHLSKVDKKDKDNKDRLYTSIREAADKYQHVFVFSVDNMRNTYLKDVRSEFSDSRLFFGKTKVMAKALGTTTETSYLPALSSLSTYLHGSVGLLFTSRPPSSLLSHFSSYSGIDYLRAGVPAPRDFIIPAGVVHSRGGEIPSSEDVPVAHSMETTLRKWGMPTRLDKGKVLLDEPYTVCREGKEVDSRAASLAKTFGVAMAEFRVKILAYWSAETQEVTVVEGEEGEGMDEDQDEDE
ncbi:mRNA turnover protein 4 [Aulographum hederae CBS 113979]|uniref:Ribosome assembly factor mrt4 n=1 Tax=Aulographum hederae CBS 113979 TaxID=1176131 RepID=A0A6G1GNP8_9PEZI|nr:mRNA turnover protein 4 [Aulographum hederae CBS 113979]